MKTLQIKDKQGNSHPVEYVEHEPDAPLVRGRSPFQLKDSDGLRQFSLGHTPDRGIAVTSEGETHLIPANVVGGKRGDALAGVIMTELRKQAENAELEVLD